MTSLVNTVGPFYGETIINKMEKLETEEGKEVTCDAIAKKELCKVYRATGSGKSTVAGLTEIELTEPGYFTKNKACHYCMEVGHAKNDCPKLVQKRSDVSILEAR